MPNSRILYPLDRRMPPLLEFLLLFPSQFRLQPFLFFGGQKLCFTRTVGQHEIGEESERDSRQSLENEKPSPAPYTQPMHMLQNEAGDQRAHNAVDRKAGKEQSQRPRLFPPPEPIGQIQNNPGIVTRLREPEQNARGVQLMSALHHPGQRRHEPPGQEDAPDPRARPDLMKNQIAGHFKEKITDKKDSRGDGKLLAGKAQVLV